MSDAAVETPRPAIQEDRSRPKKRRRIVVSCTECHRRKQKCDRDLPCGNCRTRNKESACSYEAGAPTAKRTDVHPSNSPELADGVDPVNGGRKGGARSGRGRADDTMSTVAATEWGYSNASTSTVGFLKSIEAADTEADAAGAASTFGLESQRGNSALVKEKFKSLIRQLPTRMYMDKLVHIFMTQLNWHYYMVDPAIFERQFAEWNSLPWKVLQAGPMGLSPDLRVFPAVLFQMCATALLSLDERPDPEFDALKYAGNMTFEDLGIEYSEAGAAVVSLFGKKDLAVTTVQAELLRTSFLKFTKNVAESWHALAITIRDAQELGMHKDSLDPKPANSSAEAVLENQWYIEQRRKLYGLLAIWDIHMSLILARPGVVDRRYPLPSPPVDVRPSRDLSRTPVLPRDPERDPPTPLTSIIWMLRMLDPLRDVLDMEKDGSFPREFSKVDQTHRKIFDIEDQKPAILRHENPDTRFDAEPDLYWLPYKRAYYRGLAHLSVMSLHRPYVYHRKASREAAMKAGLDMLESQRRSFVGLPSHSWRNYHLFFGCFDAVVLVATIFILFPREQTELRQAALQQFQWTIERFMAMQDRNPYARSGLGILKAILAKLTRSINNSPSPPPHTTSDTTAARFHEDATPSASGPRSHSLGGGDVSSREDGITPDVSTSYGPPTGTTNWTVPSTDTVASLAPLYPTSDLFFNDLNVIYDDTNHQNGGPTNGAAMNGVGFPANILSHDDDDDTAAAAGMMGMDSNDLDLGTIFPAQFGGEFGEESVWQFLNQYQPRTSSA